MLRPYVLAGHKVDSCVALAPRPTAGHQTLDLGMVVRIHRGQFPFMIHPEVDRWIASDPDDGPPDAPGAGAGSPDSPDGVLRPPRVRGRPVSPLPGVRPLLLHGIATLARHTLLARRRRARRRRSPSNPGGLGRRRTPECRALPGDHRLPTDAGGVGLDGA